MPHRDAPVDSADLAAIWRRLDTMSARFENRFDTMSARLESRFDELGAQVQALSVQVARGEERLQAHRELQARRTEARDDWCRAHDDRAADLERRMDELRAGQAVTEGMISEEKRPKQWVAIVALVAAIIWPIVEIARG